MAGHHKWDKIMKGMKPQRRKRIEQEARAELERMLLAELRRLSGKTQAQLAKSLGITQPSLSQLESQQDMQITTLRRIIQALGGELEIIAKLPTGRVELRQFDERLAG